MIGTAAPYLVFTATTDAAQWVQIYGLLRPTDANEDKYLRGLAGTRKLLEKILWHTAHGASALPTVENPKHK